MRSRLRGTGVPPVHDWSAQNGQDARSPVEIAAVGAPMSAIPDESRFWTAATSNGTYLLTWENFAAGRINGEAVSSPLQDGIVPPQTSGQETASPLSFAISPEARTVLETGCELWRYYHKQPKANPNASYYDIRKFFQGVKVDAKGKEKMNATSGDADYNERLAALESAMKDLAAKIQPKVYEYGFLKK